MLAGCYAGPWRNLIGVHEAASYTTEEMTKYASTPICQSPQVAKEHKI